MPGKITVLSRNSHSWLQGERKQRDRGFCSTFEEVGNAATLMWEMPSSTWCVFPQMTSINEQLNWVSPNRQWPNFKLWRRHLPLATNGDRTLARWTSGLIQYSSVPVPNLASSTSACLGISTALILWAPCPVSVWLLAACFQLKWQFKDVWYRRSPSVSEIT